MSIIASSRLDLNKPVNLLLSKLRYVSNKIHHEYLELEKENVRSGGEEGQIIITEVDSKVMDMLQIIRDCMNLGMKQKSSFFTGQSPPSLLSLLTEISLKSTFKELLLLPEEVDKLFLEPEHLEIAWIIMAINDLVLPQYINVIRENETLAKQYYDQGSSLILSDELLNEFLSIIHDIEKIYFQIEYVSYAAILKNKSSRNSSNPKINIVGSSERDTSTQIFPPELESNTGLNVPSIGDSKSLRSADSSAPRKGSPLKSSITLADAEGSENNYAVEESISTMKLDETIDASLSPTMSSESSRTTNSLLTTPTNVLADTDLGDESLIDESELNAKGSDETSSDLGFFGLKVPETIKTKIISIGNNLGIIHSASVPKNIPVPGDFESIDRFNEKEMTRALCSGSSLELHICPIKGLASQEFKCANCSTVIGINDYPQAKLCEITGYYYCPICHIDELSVSPALIINNWDFTKVPVSRQTFMKIGSQCRSQYLDLESISRALFTFVDDLNRTRQTRLELVKYSDVFLQCESENRNQIIKRLWPREHLIETVNLYTIEDLLEIKAGKLSRQLQGYLRSIEMHVTSHCKNCQRLYFNKS